MPTHNLQLKTTWLLLVVLAYLTMLETAHANLSDRLVVIDTDGRSFTTQHTLYSSGSLMVLDLPGSVVPQSVQFMGPDKKTFYHAYKNQPEKISIWSGSSLVRYDHQYLDAVSTIAPGRFVLTTPSISTELSVEGTDRPESILTWVFPSNFEILNYSQVDKLTGTWETAGNTLTYRQLSAHPVMLTIEYQRRERVEENIIDLCNTGSAKIDDCAPDTDADGVPDYRDICHDSKTTVTELFGCAENSPLILEGISFSSGHSYLDIESRQLLDRLAYALQSHSEKYFEIGAHTDSQGQADKNKQLSQKRASAVRHYLLLRGVDPNQVRATGYGEEYPRADNADEAGRSENRRIEIYALE